jgi:hypothetical protein
MLRPTYVFASGVICGSCSTFRFVRSVKHGCTIFKLGWDRYGFHNNLTRTRYVELLFLYLVLYAGHVVHFGASEARNVDALFFILGWDRYGFNKKHDGTCYAELVFLHLVGSAGHVVHSYASGARIINALFFMFG